MSSQSSIPSDYGDRGMYRYMLLQASIRDMSLRWVLLFQRPATYVTTRLDPESRTLEKPDLAIDLVGICSRTMKDHGWIVQGTACIPGAKSAPDWGQS